MLQIFCHDQEVKKSVFFFQFFASVCTDVFSYVFWQKTKIHKLLRIFDFLAHLNNASFLYAILKLITKVMFILSSNSSDSEFWSVNQRPNLWILKRLNF